MVVKDTNISQKIKKQKLVKYRKKYYKKRKVKIMIKWEKNAYFLIIRNYFLLENLVLGCPLFC